MRPTKITAAMRREIRDTVIARHAIPSNKQIAAKWGCCKAIVDALTAQIAAELRVQETVKLTSSDVPCGTNGVTITQSYITSDTEAAQ
jgi:hypothetical protein